MYFNSNNFTHGIMFHHFHDNKIHKRGQGSISKSDFIKIINYIGRKNILDAEDFISKLHKKKLKKTDVCLTFDDGIKCQYDIALPILQKFKIKSFFFVYSSLFSGEPDLLEVYRYFRNNYFITIDDFYNEFFENVKGNINNFFEKHKNLIKNNKVKFPHYSINDIKFRLIRDKFLTDKKYKDIMFNMFNKKKFNPETFYNLLFMNKNNLKDIFNYGHKIGLHSHSHPTLMEKLDYKKQMIEYKKNIQILSNVLKVDKKYFDSMSHPCGSYNDNTKKILKKLNIKIGFKQIMKVEKERKMKKINNSYIEIARQDHSDIMSMIYK